MVDLHTLSTWLCRLLDVEAIESHISDQRPLSASYKWQGQVKKERFLLAIKVTPQVMKIQYLWIPLSMQKKGIGSAIIIYLYQLAQIYELKAIFIEPRPGSEGFWQKVGFTPSEKDNYIWERPVI